MDERSTVWLSVLLGAVAGGAVGYLYFTESGRRMREDLEPRLADFMGQLQQARTSAERALQAAGDGWESVRHLDSTLKSDTQARASAGV